MKLEAMGKPSVGFKSIQDRAKVDTFKGDRAFIANERLQLLDQLVQGIPMPTAYVQQTTEKPGSYIPVTGQMIAQLTAVSPQQLRKMIISSGDNAVIDGGCVVLAIKQYEDILSDIQKYNGKQLKLGGSKYSEYLSVAAKFRTLALKAIDQQPFGLNEKDSNELERLTSELKRLESTLQGEEGMVLASYQYALQQLQLLRRYQMVGLELMTRQVVDQKPGITEADAKSALKIHAGRTTLQTVGGYFGKEIRTKQGRLNLIQRGEERFLQTLKEGPKDKTRNIPELQNIETLLQEEPKAKSESPIEPSIVQLIDNTKLARELTERERNGHLPTKESPLVIYLVQHPNVIDQTVDLVKKKGLALLLLKEMILTGFSTDPTLARQQKDAILIGINNDPNFLADVMTCFVNREKNSKVPERFAGSSLEFYQEFINSFNDTLSLVAPEELEILQDYIQRAKEAEAGVLLTERLWQWGGFSADQQTSQIQIQEIMDNLSRNPDHLKDLVIKFNKAEQEKYVQQLEEANSSIVSYFYTPDTSPLIDQPILDFYKAFCNDSQVQEALQSDPTFNNFKKFIEEAKGKPQEQLPSDFNKYENILQKIVELNHDIEKLSTEIGVKESIIEQSKENIKELQKKIDDEINKGSAGSEPAINILKFSLNNAQIALNKLVIITKNIEIQLSNMNKDREFYSKQLSTFEKSVINDFPKKSKTERDKIFTELSQIKEKVQNDLKDLEEKAKTGQISPENITTLQEQYHRRGEFVDTYFNKLKSIHERLNDYGRNNPIESAIKDLDKQQTEMLSKFLVTDMEKAVEVLDTESKIKLLNKIEEIISKPGDLKGQRSRLIVLYHTLAIDLAHPIPYQLVRTREEFNQLSYILTLQDMLNAIDPNIVLIKAYYKEVKDKIEGMLNTQDQIISNRMSAQDISDAKALLNSLESKYTQVITTQPKAKKTVTLQVPSEETIHSSLARISPISKPFILPASMANNVSEMFEKMLSNANVAGMNITSKVENIPLQKIKNTIVQGDDPLCFSEFYAGSNFNVLLGDPTEIIGNSSASDDNLQKMFFGLSDSQTIEYYNISNDDLWKLVVASEGKRTDGGLIAKQFERLAKIKKEIEDNVSLGFKDKNKMLREVETQYNHLIKHQRIFCGILMNKSFICENKSKDAIGNNDELVKIRNAYKNLTGSDLPESNLISDNRVIGQVNLALTTHEELARSFPIESPTNPIRFSFTLSEAVSDFSKACKVKYDTQFKILFAKGVEKLRKIFKISNPLIKLSPDADTAATWAEMRLVAKDDADYMYKLSLYCESVIEKNDDIYFLLDCYGEINIAVKWIDNQIKELKESSFSDKDPIIERYESAKKNLQNLNNNLALKIAEHPVDELDRHPDLKERTYNILKKINPIFYENLLEKRGAAYRIMNLKSWSGNPPEDITDANVKVAWNLLDKIKNSPSTIKLADLKNLGNLFPGDGDKSNKTLLILEVFLCKFVLSEMKDPAELRDYENIIKYIEAHKNSQPDYEEFYNKYKLDFFSPEDQEKMDLLDVGAIKEGIKKYRGIEQNYKYGNIAEEIELLRNMTSEEHDSENLTYKSLLSDFINTRVLDINNEYFHNSINIVHRRDNYLLLMNGPSTTIFTPTDVAKIENNLINDAVNEVFKILKDQTSPTDGSKKRWDKIQDDFTHLKNVGIKYYDEAYRRIENDIKVIETGAQRDLFDRMLSLAYIRELIDTHHASNNPEFIKLKNDIARLERDAFVFLSSEPKRIYSYFEKDISDDQYKILFNAQIYGCANIPKMRVGPQLPDPTKVTAEQKEVFKTLSLMIKGRSDINNEQIGRLINNLSSLFIGDNSVYNSVAFLDKFLNEHDKNGQLIKAYPQLAMYIARGKAQLTASYTDKLGKAQSSKNVLSILESICLDKYINIGLKNFVSDQLKEFKVVFIDNSKSASDANVNFLLLSTFVNNHRNYLSNPDAIVKDAAKVAFSKIKDRFTVPNLSNDQLIKNFSLLKSFVEINDSYLDNSSKSEISKAAINVLLRMTSECAASQNSTIKTDVLINSYNALEQFCRDNAVYFNEIGIHDDVKTSMDSAASSVLAKMSLDCSEKGLSIQDRVKRVLLMKDFAEKNQDFLLKPDAIGANLIGSEVNKNLKASLEDRMYLLKEIYRDKIDRDQIYRDKIDPVGALGTWLQLDSGVLAMEFIDLFITNASFDFETRISNYLLLQSFLKVENNPLADHPDFAKKFNEVQSNLLTEAKTKVQAFEGNPKEDNLNKKYETLGKERGNLKNPAAAEKAIQDRNDLKLAKHFVAFHESGQGRTRRYTTDSMGQRRSTAVLSISSFSSSRNTLK